MKTIELFAGIGGLHAACPWLDVVAAVDINRDSQSVYGMNFSTPYFVRELESIPFDWLAAHQADLWWMSPPCTPFTRKGERRDLEDVRTRSLMHLVEAVCSVRPSLVVLENVVGFETSQAIAILAQRWRDAGYGLQVQVLCPTQLGWPNRRPRVYVIASRTEFAVPPISKISSVTLKEILLTCEVAHPLGELMLEPQLASRYGAALDIVDLDDASSVAACFGSSYGRAITKSGSYVQAESGIRRFAPREVANILGFPSTFVLPEHVPNKRLWQLLGNSLSLPAVSHLMQVTR